jgi:hypothetical protein
MPDAFAMALHAATRYSVCEPLPKVARHTQVRTDDRSTS